MKQTLDTIVVNARQSYDTPSLTNATHYLLMTDDGHGFRLVIEFDLHPRRQRILEEWSTEGGPTNRPARIVFTDRRGWPTATLVSIEPLATPLEEGQSGEDGSKT